MMDPSYSFQFSNEDSEREEANDISGVLTGSYSYKTPGGQDILVKYTAGSDTGFVIQNMEELNAALERSLAPTATAWRTAGRWRSSTRPARTASRWTIWRSCWPVFILRRIWDRSWSLKQLLLLLWLETSWIITLTISMKRLSRTSMTKLRPSPTCMLRSQPRCTFTTPQGT